MLPVVTRVVKLVQHPHGIINQIIKVHRAGGKQASPILLIELADLFLSDITGFVRSRKILLRCNLCVLRAADLIKNHPMREHFVVNIEILQNVLHYRLTVRRVINCETGRISESFCLFPQNTHTGRMKRARPDICCLWTEHSFQTFLELPCRLVCKGDGNDAPWLHRHPRSQLTGRIIVRIIFMTGAAAKKIDVFFRNVFRSFIRIGCASELQQIRNAADQHGRFSAAGSGQQKKRPLSGEDRFFLHVVQARKMRLNEARSRAYKFVLKFIIIFHSGLF